MQERLKEIPNANRSGPGPQFYSEDQQIRLLPGSELDQPGLQPGAQVNVVESFGFYNGSIESAFLASVMADGFTNFCIRVQSSSVVSAL